MQNNMTVAIETPGKHGLVAVVEGELQVYTEELTFFYNDPVISRNTKKHVSGYNKVRQQNLI